MPKGTSNEPTLEELTAEECLELLAGQTVGRFAVAAPGTGPLVVPVNYVMDKGAVVFRAGTGEKLELVHGQHVSFQIDDFDPYHRTGWSVLVRGSAYEATHWEVEHLLLDSWAPGKKDRWIRIHPATVTGRRIRLAPYEPDPHAYM